MKISHILVATGLLLGQGIHAAPVDTPDTAPDSTSAKPPALPGSFEAMDAKYKAYVKSELQKRTTLDRCNQFTVHTRREWGAMSKLERKNYINAVKCLAKLPAKSDKKIVPGARSRFDDFVASHIQQAYNIHFSGNLFAWHRTFLWEYEQALRSECGYSGAHPYWDWAKYYLDPASSPLFDGSEYSLGSNGEYFPHGATILEAFGLKLTLPGGTGGGRVYKGPFANFTVNLGLTPPDPEPAEVARLPIPSNDTVSVNNAFLPVVAKSALDYNPRPLTRDINHFWSNQTKKSDVEFLLKCTNVDCLEKTADGWATAEPVQPILHAAGHFTIGGLANDPFASPGDPAFYLHHAMFDRVWTIWQAQDPSKRTYQVGGTITPFNKPPSAAVTLNDVLKFEAAGPNYKMKDTLSAINGKFCYKYE
ncbi:MAG: hypothetical protein Q9166_000921 [cf. Caloplaca sp. 2 TL-2023]